MPRITGLPPPLRRELTFQTPSPGERGNIAMATFGPGTQGSKGARKGRDRGARWRMRRRPPRLPLSVEVLPDRTLLSTVSWDGGGGDFLWNNSLNWDTDALPGASDDAVIGAAFSVA